MPQSILVGNHLYFAREGTVVDTLTVGREAKPDNSPTTNWTSVGLVSSATVETSQNDIDIFKPSPGRLRLYDVLEGKRDMSITCTIEEASPLMWELLFGSQPIPSTGLGAGVFAPLSRTGKVKGWFKFQQYNQADQLISVVDVYCVADIDGAVEFGGDQSAVITFSLKLRVLSSPLESGQLSNLA